MGFIAISFTLRFFLSAFVCVLLAACGQMGDLYMPTPTPVLADPITPTPVVVATPTATVLPTPPLFSTAP